MAEPSVREALEKSIDTLSASTTGNTPAPTGDIAPLTPAPAGDKPASITDTPPQTTAKLGQQGDNKDAKLPEPVAGKEPAPVAAKEPAAGDQSTIVLKAPVAWKPEIREKWAALPTEVKTEVLRREKELQQTMQQSASARAFMEEFNQVSAPYRQLMALEGDDPIRSFQNYLRTATILRNGTAHEKANAVAQAIGTYNIDVNLLDSALAAALQGQPMPQNQSGAGPIRDPRVDALLENMSQQQQQQLIQLDQELTSEIEAFASDPKNEFFEDLRGDVSDLLRLKADRGQRMTLQEAYDQAAMLHPTISKIVMQRKQAAEQQQQNQQNQQRRHAASSLTNQSPRQTGNQAGESQTVRQAILESIDKLGG